MRTWFYTIAVPIFALSFGGCAKDLPESKEVPVPIVSALSIVKTDPIAGATDVPLDTTFTITFDQKVDAYSAIPENFEVWTDDGARLGAPKLVSTKFVPHPDFPDFMVSQITVSLNGTYLLPNQKYHFYWGKPADINEEVGSSAYGVQSLFGAPLDSGSISFTTGTRYNALTHENLELLSISPGRVLSRGKVFEFDAKLGDLFNLNSAHSYVTVAPKASIYANFSEPIVDTGSEYELTQHGLSELDSTPIDEFGNMLIIAVSKDMKFNELFNSINDLDWEAWLDFRNSFSDRLQGTVRTTNGRKTLIFELDQDCDIPERCSYPKWPGSVIVVVFKDLYAWQTDRPLLDTFVTAGFYHFPGFKTDNPFFGEGGGE